MKKSNRRNSTTSAVPSAPSPAHADADVIVAADPTVASPTAADAIAPGPIDPSSHPGFGHYQEMKPRFIDTKPTRKVLNVDIEVVATVLMAVHDAVIGLKLRNRLALIPSSLFDLTILDRILAYAWVLRFIATMRRTEVATAETTLISPALAAKAEPVKARMLKVVKHALGERAEYTKEIASIEAGRGYEDTAHDLMRLSLIYNTEAGLISRDPVHYVATDAEDAKTYYHQILDELSDKSNSVWSKVALKAFSVIEREYGRLRGTVLWAWHDDAEVQAAVPTLFPRVAVAGRAAEEEEETADVTPTAAVAAAQPAAAVAAQPVAPTTAQPAPVAPSKAGSSEDDDE